MTESCPTFPRMNNDITRIITTTTNKGKKLETPEEIIDYV